MFAPSYPSEVNSEQEICWGSCFFSSWFTKFTPLDLLEDKMMIVIRSVVFNWYRIVLQIWRKKTVLLKIIFKVSKPEYWALVSGHHLSGFLDCQVAHTDFGNLIVRPYTKWGKMHGCNLYIPGINPHISCFAAKR